LPGSIRDPSEKALLKYLYQKNVLYLAVFSLSPLIANISPTICVSSPLLGGIGEKKPEKL
jgi:hypothetical protein